MVAGLVRQVAEGAAAIVIVVALLLEVGDDHHRVGVGPVGEQDDVVAVGTVALAGARLQDQGAVEAGLFLHAGMAMVPVGAGLADREAVDEGLARHDAAEAEARNAILIAGQAQPVPMDRGGFRQVIGDGDDRLVALAQAQDRGRRLAVDPGRDAGATGEVDRDRADGEVNSGAAQNLRLGPGARRTKPTGQAHKGQPLGKASAA